MQLWTSVKEANVQLARSTWNTSSRGRGRRRMRTIRMWDEENLHFFVTKHQEQLSSQLEWPTVNWRLNLKSGRVLNSSSSFFAWRHVTCGSKSSIQMQTSSMSQAMRREERNLLMSKNHFLLRQVSWVLFLGGETSPSSVKSKKDTNFLSIFYPQTRFPFTLGVTWIAIQHSTSNLPNLMATDARGDQLSCNRN